jgi:hypothetical protein
MSGRGIFSIVVLVILTGIGYAGDADRQVVPAGNRPAKEVDNYRDAAREAERHLVAEARPYVLLDLKKQEFLIKLQGAKVRRCPFQAADSNALANFAQGWIRRNQPAQMVDRVHLFAATGVLDDKELQVLSEVSDVDKDRIQRYLPGDMLIVLSSGMRLRITTEKTGGTISFLGNIREDFLSGFWSFLGRKALRVHLTADDAMSLYGLCRNKPGILMIH